MKDERLLLRRGHGIIKSKYAILKVVTPTSKKEKFGITEVKKFYT